MCVSRSSKMKAEDPGTVDYPFSGPTHEAPHPRLSDGAQVFLRSLGDLDLHPQNVVVAGGDHAVHVILTRLRAKHVRTGLREHDT